MIGRRFQFQWPLLRSPFSHRKHPPGALRFAHGLGMSGAAG